MNKPSAENQGSPIWMLPLKILAWPFVKCWQILYKHFITYLIGRVLRDENRIYSIKFIWYGDSVYLHPMIWGGAILYFVAKAQLAMADADRASDLTSGWPLLIWFMTLGLCFLTIMYNFNIVRAAMLVVALVAILGLAYFTNVEWQWNPLSALGKHIDGLQAGVTPGFYIVSSYVFAMLIAAEVIWAWLFHRVEIDESYVYEHRFLQGTSREPIFARGLKRETKDLLELLILGAADIQHRTKTGFKRFKNVPAASLGLGTAIDSLLDYRRKGQVELEQAQRDEADQARLEDAMHDIADDADDDGADVDPDFGDDDGP